MHFYSIVFKIVETQFIDLKFVFVLGCLYRRIIFIATNCVIIWNITGGIIINLPYIK